MTVRSSTRRALLTGLLVVPVLATAGPAAADPPGSDNRCTILLADAASWPGGGIPGGAHFSDAYEQHLLAQPACRAR